MSIVLTDDDAKANIAANLQRLLAAKGWSQADLARALGESEARVSLTIRGLKLASAAFLARVAEVLETTVDELLASPPDSPRKKSRQSA